MGVKSTHHTDRKTAIKTILGKMAEIHELSNEQLENLLEHVLDDFREHGECFMNFFVHDELTDEHEPKYYGE